MFHLPSFIEGIVVGFIGAFVLSAAMAALFGLIEHFGDEPQGPEVTD